MCLLTLLVCSMANRRSNPPLLLRILRKREQTYYVLYSIVNVETCDSDGEVIRILAQKKYIFESIFMWYRNGIYASNWSCTKCLRFQYLVMRFNQCL